MSDLYTYIGAGQVYLENLSASKGLLPIGEVSKLEMSIETDKKTLQSHVQGGGGLADSVARISALNFAMDVNSLSPENLAMAMYGSTSAAASETITDESHTAYPGALVSFTAVPDLTDPASVVVTGTGGTPTYVLGTDYDLSPAGILIKASGSIAAATPILVDYLSKAHNVLEMLTNSGDSYRLVFEGLNEARSDKPVIAELYRNKFDPTSGLGLISDDFGTLSLTGSVLKDPAKAGAGISKYMNIKMV